MGLNAQNNQAGKVSYHVYQAFIALQAAGPLAGLLLNEPSKVQRTDGVPVDMSITNGSGKEMVLTAKLFFSKDFLLIVPLIGQGVYAEAVMFTYESLWFSVRARALGSFMSGIVAIIAGNVLGAYLDRNKIALKTRARSAFITILGLQGAWWIWATVLVTRFHYHTHVRSHGYRVTNIRQTEIVSQRMTGSTMALARRSRCSCFGWLGSS